MKITLSPQQGLPGQPEMTITVNGDLLIIDGTTYDLSAVPEGGEGWPDEGPFVGPIKRIGGKLYVTVIARLGDTAADVQGGPWIIENASGAIAIPAERKPVEAE